MVLPSISQSFSPVPLVSPTGIFLCPTGKCSSSGAVGVVQGASMAYHRSDPLPAQEQDQLVPKLFTTDVCLSSYSKKQTKNDGDVTVSPANLSSA